MVDSFRRSTAYDGVSIERVLIRNAGEFEGTKGCRRGLLHSATPLTSETTPNTRVICALESVMSNEAVLAGTVTQLSPVYAKSWRNGLVRHLDSKEPHTPLPMCCGQRQN